MMVGGLVACGCLLGGISQAVVVSDDAVDMNPQSTVFRCFAGKDTQNPVPFVDGLPFFRTSTGSIFFDSCPYYNPGPKPFAGNCELVVKFDRPLAANHEVIIYSRADRKTKSHWAKSTNDEVRVKLPEGLYQFQSIHPRFADKELREFRLVSVKAVREVPAAQAVRLDVETGNLMRAVRSDSERPYLIVGNAADRKLRFVGRATAHDYFETKPQVEFPIDVEVAAGSAAKVAIPHPLPTRGIWFVTAVLSSEGSVSTNEARFAVLDDHRPTPYLPKPHFRVGLHVDYPTWSRTVEREYRDIAVASGAKIVRSSFGSFDRVYGSSFDETKAGWAKADAWLALWRDVGMAVDSVIYSTPIWARPPEKRNIPWRNQVRNIPPEPGLFKAFCEKLGRHYGHQIDYYEIGNEFDLVPPDIFGVDEGLRVLREAHEGLKAADPTLCVALPGWACSVSSEFPKGRMPQPGFIERFMERATGFYDVHTVHLHGPYWDYPGRVKSLFRLQKSIGTYGKVPWFANETAHTIFGGQEKRVAEEVWQKVIYSWANGSTDYIWYCLRATGWFEDDTEQNYGLVTADYRPRATYAAFSALTALVHGLDRDKLLIDQFGRYAFRAKGKVDGKPAIALFGWDVCGPRGGADYRVLTDAKSAVQVDLMGNRRERKVGAGGAFWKTGPCPSAIVLFGATKAEMEDAFHRVSPPKPQSRPTTFVLDKVTDFKTYYGADPDPESLARLWQGPQDLSAKFRFARRDGKFAMRIDVTDDVDAAPREGRDETDGDSAVVSLRGDDGVVSRHVITRRWRKGNVTTYAFTTPLTVESPELQVEIYENDGKGADGVLVLPWSKIVFDKQEKEK